MHILMLSDVYFPRINGVSTSIETFRRRLAELGVRVSLIAPDYPPGTHPHAAPVDPAVDPQVIRIASRQLVFDPEDRLMRYRDAVEAAFALDARDPVDVVHVQTPFVAHYAGLKLATRRGLPLVSTYHTLFEEYVRCYLPWLPERLARGFARRLSRRQCEQCSTVIVPSTAMRERLLQYGVRTPLAVLPTGIDIAQFSRGDGAAFRACHGIPAAAPLLLFVGRLAHEKNIGFLLRVVERLRRQVPEVMLLIAGEGPARESLDAEVRQLGIGRQVRFVGNLDRKRELPDCYAAAQVFTFASRTETQGLVLLEAMSMGVPVVALAEMGTRDILGPGQGCLTPRDDVDDFAAELAALLHDPARCQRLAAEARTCAEGWDDGALARRLQALYRSVAALPVTRIPPAAVTPRVLHSPRRPAP